MGLVCLGASAGGLRSLEAVLRELPASFPWPILVSQHLQPDHPSQLAEILARATPLHVEEAVDGELPRPGCVYTSPSDAELGVAPTGRLILRPPIAGRPQRIDHLFATAAFASPNLVVTIVLSGTGSDGAAGALVAKMNGGTVLVESKDTAQRWEMPEAALRTGTVDAVLAPADIARLLERLANGALEAGSLATQREVDLIAEDLRDATGTRFDHYRRATLRRRILKRSALVGAQTLAEYRALVHADAAERGALVQSLLIPVTEFFRDATAWEALRRESLPPLLARARAGGSVRIWCAGCAGGEDAYSIAILVAEELADRSRVTILGTDVDATAIASAKQGAYEPSHMRGVDALRRERFFRADRTKFRVTDTLRSFVSFQQHDLTREDAPGSFDLIICRNVLIYFDEQLQAEVITKFRSALAPHGTLLLGRSEALPQDAETFEPLVRQLRLYRARVHGDGASRERPKLATTRAAGSRSADDSAAPIRVDEPDTIVLSLDAAWNVTAANARATALLGRDVTGVHVLDVFPRWQGSPVHDALKTVAATGRSGRVRNAPAEWGPMDVTVEALATPARTILLIGRPHPHAAAATPSSVAGADEIGADLAATNDELQAANEELAATNEELQAANEELASLNEEFQSTNENLAATNEELESGQARVDERVVRAILDNHGDAIVTLDDQKRIVIYNDAARHRFGLDASSIGLPLDPVRFRLDPRDLDGPLDAPSPSTRHVATTRDGSVVVFQRLRSSGGRGLGWILSWSPAP